MKRQKKYVTHSPKDNILNSKRRTIESKAKLEQGSDMLEIGTDSPD